ncbi:MAG TPA: FeoB-associated Cys-rich membrane protein [Opitutaceae bacterium]|nr:FeoB-associated Cys-rich membrane protein [Opitutaceae bacterium]HND60582.1 FeoB-associated Cys-rich membrane protein [Opitutaceae bacterium]
MNSHTQTIVALAVVALAAAWLVRRAIRQRRHPGCSDDCGCPATELRGPAARRRP